MCGQNFHFHFAFQIKHAGVSRGLHPGCRSRPRVAPRIAAYRGDHLAPTPTHRHRATSAKVTMHRRHCRDCQYIMYSTAQAAAQIHTCCSHGSGSSSENTQSCSAPAPAVMPNERWLGGSADGASPVPGVGVAAAAPSACKRGCGVCGSVACEVKAKGVQRCAACVGAIHHGCQRLLRLLAVLLSCSTIYSGA